MHDSEEVYICCGNALIKEDTKPLGKDRVVMSVDNLKIIMKRIPDHSAEFPTDPYDQIRDKLTFEDKMM